MCKNPDRWSGFFFFRRFDNFVAQTIRKKLHIKSGFKTTQNMRNLPYNKIWKRELDLQRTLYRFGYGRFKYLILSEKDR
jgi:hypothetical protein